MAETRQAIQNGVSMAGTPAGHPKFVLNLLGLGQNLEPGCQADRLMK